MIYEELSDAFSFERFKRPLLYSQSKSCLQEGGVSWAKSQQNDKRGGGKLKYYSASLWGTILEVFPGSTKSLSDPNELLGEDTEREWCPEE